MFSDSLVKFSKFYIIPFFVPKLTKACFAGRGAGLEVVVTLYVNYVNLMYNWLFLTTSPVKSVSFREKMLLYM